MPRSLYFERPDITTSQDLSAAALSFTTTIPSKFRLTEVLIHFDATTTETITITKDSAIGANYDTVLRKRSIVSETDFVYRPQGDSDFQSGDNLKVECTNANALNIAYVTIKTNELGT